MGLIARGGRDRILQPLKTFLALLLCLIIQSSVTAFAASPTPSPSNDELKMVEATGFSTISVGNTALARDAAIDDALRKAVEQAVGTLVSSETMVENFQVLRDSVYTKTQGYVKTYSVVNESASGGLYQTTVRASVAVGSIRDDLDAIGLLHARAEKPRVLFMVAEQNIGHRYFVFWWWGQSEYKGETVDISAAETALKELFVNKGFNVVDPSVSPDRVAVSNAYRVADLTNEGAREIGRKLNAEIVVKGKAIAKEGPRTPGSQVGSYLADITVQAVRVDNGAVLASSRGHGTSRHVSDVTGGTEAITRASAEAGEKIIDQILSKWQAGNLVTLRIRGVKDFKDGAALKEALRKQVRGVKAVYQRRFEGDELELELDANTSANRIADELSRITRFRIKVVNTTSATIDAVIE